MGQILATGCGTYHRDLELSHQRHRRANRHWRRQVSTCFSQSIWISPYRSPSLSLIILYRTYYIFFFVYIYVRKDRSPGRYPKHTHTQPQRSVIVLDPALRELKELFLLGVQDKSIQVIDWWNMENRPIPMILLIPIYFCMYIYIYNYIYMYVCTLYIYTYTCSHCGTSYCCWPLQYPVVVDHILKYKQFTTRFSTDIHSC